MPDNGFIKTSINMSKNISRENLYEFFLLNV